MPVKVPTRVVVHPIVLLSVVDHFNRLRKIGNQKRVVGVLLGKWRASGVVDIATSYAGRAASSLKSFIGTCNIFLHVKCLNTPYQIASLFSQFPSFAVPFDEDEREPSVWFLDHNYLENMTAMFRKVNGASIAVAP